MSIYRFVATKDVPAWLEALRKTFSVVAPCLQGKAVVFASLDKDDVVSTLAPNLERATVSPKGCILPPSETLLRYSVTKDSEDLAKTSLQLDDGLGSVATPTLLLGARSCDTRGFLALDWAYTHGPYSDPYYKARRDATLIVTRACDKPCATCFCHWVGGGPVSTEGSDVQLTVLDDGWLLQAVSEKGESLLAAAQLSDGAERAAEANEQHAAAKALMAPAPDISGAPAKLKARFEDVPFWTEHTHKCLSCGACTYMCPTCQCFTMTDEGDGLSGKRIRSWDNCMSPQFTREASGHNPRQGKSLRMRNRVSHKYWYSQEQHGGISCTGCGRCVTRCPVSLDIREILTKAVES